MKKSVSKVLAASAMSLLCVGALVGCGPKEEKQTIRIQFVPSNDPGKLATLAKNMAPMLEEIEPDYHFEITTGSSYAATTTAMLSDQIDIGFLTASGYAEATLKNKGKIEVLMTSVRKGYTVQQDFKEEADVRAAMNQELNKDGSKRTKDDGKEDYEYLGQQSEADVNWYSSQLVVANKYYTDFNGDGEINVKDLAGRDDVKLGRMGPTSGAGYLRPLKYLDDNGLTMVDSYSKDPKAKAKEIVGVNYGASGYSSACQAMIDGDIAGFWGYTDVRYSNFYSKKDSELFEDKSLFTDYKVMAVTDGIYNDTISARANLDEKAKKAVKHAFKELVKDGNKDEEGTGAFYLYNLYSHTGYTDAVDADFEGERKFYKFCVDNGLIK